jgi:hypothetical protein
MRNRILVVSRSSKCAGRLRYGAIALKRARPALGTSLAAKALPLGGRRGDCHRLAS